jgi:hypothetical protein
MKIRTAAFMFATAFLLGVSNSPASAQPPSAPLPAQPAAGIYDKPIAPKRPDPEPKTPDQTFWEEKALRNEGLAGDPATTAFFRG